MNTDIEPKERAYKIKNLWGKPKEIIRLFAAGIFTQIEIAQIVGCDAQTVNNILNSELGKEHLSMLDGAADAETVDMLKRYKILAEVSLSIQQEMLLGDYTSLSLKNKIADKIQDRAGYTPISKNIHMSVSSGLETSDLDRIKARAKELKEIEEGVYVESED